MPPRWRPSPTGTPSRRAGCARSWRSVSRTTGASSPNSRTERPSARVVGLYDEPEEHVVRRAVAAAGLGTPSGRADLERLGFHACVTDLEAEFIRAIGTDGVEQLIEREGELLSLRRFQAQPAQRGRPADQQLRRFMGTKSMRKIRYGHLLAAAVDLDAVPDPLRRVTVELLPPG